MLLGELSRKFPPQFLQGQTTTGEHIDNGLVCLLITTNLISFLGHQNITFCSHHPLDRLCSWLSCVGPMKPALLSLLFSHRLNSKKLFCPIRPVPTETLATQANIVMLHDNPKRQLQRILKYLRIHFVWVLVAVFSRQRYRLQILVGTI